MPVYRLTVYKKVTEKLTEIWEVEAEDEDTAEEIYTTEGNLVSSALFEREIEEDIDLIDEIPNFGA